MPSAVTCSCTSVSPVRQLTAFTPITYWLPKFAMEPFNGSLCVGALANLAGDIGHQARVRRLFHQLQRLRDLVVGNDVEERRLPYLRGEALPQRPVEDEGSPVVFVKSAMTIESFSVIIGA